MKFLTMQNYTSLSVWERRYRQEGLAGLVSRYRPQKGFRTLSPAQQQQILSWLHAMPRLSVQALCRQLQAAFPGERLPNYQTVRRFIRTQTDLQSTGDRP